MSTTDQETRTSAQAAEECIELAHKVRDLRQTPADKRGDTWAADLAEASNALQDVNREFDTLRSTEQFNLELVAFLRDQEGERSGEGRRGPQAGTADLGSGEARSAGEIVTDSDQYKDLRDGKFEGVEVRNLLTGSSLGTSGSHLFAPVGQPIPPTPRQRRLFVRDVLSVQQTGLQSVPYIKELSPATNETGATTVSEASAKPEVTMQFESADAPIRKIAAWIQATMEALEDAPTLAGYINTRLSYMLLVEEEDQILQGDGTAPNISGILDQSGIQTQSATNNDVPATVADAIAKVELVDGDPDGIAMNPGDFWASVSERRSTHFDGEAHPATGSPFGSPDLSLWGLPVIRTRTLASLTAIVGSWRLGATLFERMGVTIRSTDSHASLFISNTVVILAEERVGLAVHRPDFFVNTTLDITA